MDPDPLRGVFPDPSLHNRIDPGHDGEDVPLLIAGFCDRQWRGDNEFLPVPAETHDVGGHDRAIEFQRQPGNGGAGHGVPAEERHRNAVIHFLIDRHSDVPALFDSLQQQPCAALAFGDGGGLVVIAGLLDDPVEPGIIALPVHY